MSKTYSSGGFIGANYTYGNTSPLLQSVVTSGLTLSLDAGDFYSYDGSGSTWTDLSGNGNNGSLSNVTYTGGPGGYFTFNGTNSIVDCGTSASLYSTSLTIEAFIYPFSGGEGNIGRIVDRSAADTVGYQLLLDNTASTQLVRYNRFPTASGIVGTSNLYTLNTWQQFAIIQEGTTSLLLCKNGAIRTSTSRAVPGAGTANFYIGNRAALDRTFDGRIAIVRFYNRALSIIELQQNFNAVRRRYGI